MANVNEFKNVAEWIAFCKQEGYIKSSEDMTNATISLIGLGREDLVFDLILISNSIPNINWNEVRVCAMEKGKVSLATRIEQVIPESKPQGINTLSGAGKLVATLAFAGVIGYGISRLIYSK